LFGAIFKFFVGAIVSISFAQGADLLFNLPDFHGFADSTQPTFHRLFPDMLDLHFKLFDVVLLVHTSMFCFEIVEGFKLYKDTIRKRTKNSSFAKASEDKARDQIMIN